MALPKTVYVYEYGKPGAGDYCLLATTDPGENEGGLGGNKLTVMRALGVYDLREKLHVRHKVQIRRLGSTSKERRNNE